MTFPPNDNIADAIQLTPGVRYDIPAGWWATATIESGELQWWDGHTIWFKYHYLDGEDVDWALSAGTSSGFYQYYAGWFQDPVLRFAALAGDLTTYAELGIHDNAYPDIGLFSGTDGYIYFQLDTKSGSVIDWIRVGQLRTVPPLRQVQRTDGLTGGGARGNGRNSIQSSERAGPVGTYL